MLTFAQKPYDETAIFHVVQKKGVLYCYHECIHFRRDWLRHVDMHGHSYTHLIPSLLPKCFVYSWLHGLRCVLQKQGIRLVGIRESINNQHPRMLWWRIIIDSWTALFTVFKRLTAIWAKHYFEERLWSQSIHYKKSPHQGGTAAHTEITVEWVIIVIFLVELLLL